MQSMRIGRAFGAVAIIASISSVSALSLAQQGYRDSGSQSPNTPQDQGSRNRSNQQNPSGQNEQNPSASSMHVVTSAATIQKIDKANRMLTLNGPQGNTFDVKAGPNVDLDRIQVGDRVNATYYEEMAVAISRHTQGAPRAATTTVQRGGVTAVQATVTARIESVDANKHTVTIRGTNGTKHTLEVNDPNLQSQLAKIKPGDNMDITYSQAVAISLEPNK